MNCFLSLKAYQIIEHSRGEPHYKLSEFAKEILMIAEDTNAVHERFAAHILNNLCGMALLKAIHAINARGEEPQLEPIAYELQKEVFRYHPMRFTQAQ